MDQEIKILLVDDDEEDFIITKDILNEIPEKKYQLEWSSNYEDAITSITQNRYDIFLIDYRLGNHTGLELIRDAIEKGAKQPFILLTGQGNIAVDEEASRAGASDYLVKNQLNPSQLERSIRYSIEKAKHLKEITTLNEELEARVAQRTKELQQANASLQEQIREKNIIEEKLRTSQKLFETIAKNFPNGLITVFDEQFHYIFFEGQEIKNLGLKNVEFYGKSPREVFPEIANVLEEQLVKIFEGEHVHFELQFRKKEYELNGVPLYNNQGNIQNALIVARDITEQKKAAEDIKKALEKERELNELKSRFISMASHEFRTPLSTVQSSISLLNKYNLPVSEEKPQKQIKRIKTSIKHLNNILDDFLSLSKVEEGKIEINPEFFNLQEFVQNIAEEMQQSAKKGQQIQYRHQSKENQVYVDKNLLNHILLNLLSNAIKYSPEGKNIAIETSINDGHIKIAVIDQGIGIPEADKPYMFGRFFRAKNATNIQGTGLGLNIIARYLEIMGGSIDFESSMEEGTTFYIDLSQNNTYHEKHSDNRGQ